MKIGLVRTVTLFVLKELTPVNATVAPFASGALVSSSEILIFSGMPGRRVTMTVVATSGTPASAAAGKKPNVSAIKAGKITALVFTRICLNVLFGIFRVFFRCLNLHHLRFGAKMNDYGCQWDGYGVTSSGKVPKKNAKNAK